MARNRKRAYEESEEIFDVDELEDFNEDAKQVVKNNKRSIIDFQRLGFRVGHGRETRDVVNVRMISRSLDEIRDAMTRIYSDRRRQFKMNYSFGFLLQHRETQRHSYYHPRASKAVLRLPVSITNRDEFVRFVRDIDLFSGYEYATQQRPDTKFFCKSVLHIQFYLYQMPRVLLGCAGASISDETIKSRSVMTFLKNRRGIAYDDYLCLFRCIAYKLHGKQFESKTREFYDDFKKRYRIEVSRGIPLDHLDLIEDCFGVRILLYEKKDYVPTMIRNSRADGVPVLIHVENGHCCLIVNIDVYSATFRCRHCRCFFAKNSHLRRHEKKECDARQRHRYFSGVYRPKLSVFEKLEIVGIDVAAEKRFYPYRACFDYESILVKTGLRGNSAKVQFVNRHEPVSCSLTSNVPGHDKLVTLISDGDPFLLVQNMILVLDEVQKEASKLLREEFREELKLLNELIVENKELEPPKNSSEKSQLELLCGELERWLDSLPVIGFHSSRYDVPLILRHLIKIFFEEKGFFTLKRQSSYLLISTPKFRFLDISLFLTPGFSLDAYLKLYGDGTASKFYFPYEWFDDIDKLNYASLPSHDDFYSSHKGKNITVEQYEECRRVWEENNMKTFRDFLIYYNESDVGPFLTALTNNWGVFKGFNIDMFKGNVSLPNIANKLMFRNCNDVTLINPANADLHQTVLNNLLGGLSIITKRYAMANETKIRESRFGDKAKYVKKVEMYDSNSLYLSAIAQNMPCGYVIRWIRSGDVFRRKAEWPTQAEYEWLQYEAHIRKITIRHAWNGPQTRIGNRRLPVDGYCSENKTVFQYDGCYWHGCECLPNRTRKQEERKSKTDANVQYFEKLGYTVVRMRECRWKEMKRIDKSIGAYTRTLKRNVTNAKQLTTEKLLDAVLNGTFFGAIECNIKCPDELKQHFEEFPPFFKHIEVDESHIGEHMRQYAAENGIKFPKKFLGSSYFVDKQLISTPLLRWYLNHGMIVTHVFQAAEWHPKACFVDFRDRVIEERRKGDVKPKCPYREMLAMTWKTSGNSAFGSCIQSPLKYRTHSYGRFDDLPTHVQNKHFLSAEKIDEDLIEITSLPTDVRWQQPIVIGYFIFGYAKLRMLMFIYDFLHVYFDDSDWSFLESDTDSALLELSDDLYSLVKPEMREQFFEQHDSWLIARACDKHKRDFAENPSNFPALPCCKEVYELSRRTAGVFKIETTSRGYVGLNSKSYYMKGGPDGDKYSSKGLMKTPAKTFKDFHDVLLTKVTTGGTNRGFRSIHGDIFTYKQYRDALSYGYYKRVVMSDGINTLPLNI